LDIRLFFAAGAGELKEEESSSFAAGAVRCGFKENCCIGLGRAETERRTGNLSM